MRPEYYLDLLYPLQDQVLQVIDQTETVSVPSITSSRMSL